MLVVTEHFQDQTRQSQPNRVLFLGGGMVGFKTGTRVSLFVVTDQHYLAECMLGLNSLI